MMSLQQLPPGLMELMKGPSDPVGDEGRTDTKWTKPGLEHVLNQTGLRVLIDKRVHHIHIIHTPSSGAS